MPDLAASAWPAAGSDDVVDADHLRPAEVAEQLGVSPATLRRWSQRFAAFLDLGEAAADSHAHRRYTEHDVAVLRQVKELLEQGWTYEHVASQLRQATGAPSPVADRPEGVDENQMAAPSQIDDLARLDPAPSPTPADLDARSGQALVPAPPEMLSASDNGLPPAALMLQNAIQAVVDNQQLLLNSQHAGRDLLGVMIQDNLNLKTENTGLRERMLDLERELAEVRRHQGDYRERMETRVRVLEDAVATLMSRLQAPAAASPPVGQSTAAQPAAGQVSPQPPEKRGFWSRLLGV